MRAVLDPNVLVSAVLSRKGMPAQLLTRWLLGEFDVVVSPDLLDELSRVLAYPKIAKYIATADARDFVSLLESRAINAAEPDGPLPIHCTDPDDDYLIALSLSTSAALVTGDAALLARADRIPVFSPRAFSDFLHGSAA